MLALPFVLGVTLAGQTPHVIHGPPLFSGVITHCDPDLPLAIVSGGRNHGLLEGHELYVFRDGNRLTSIIVDKVDRLWSAGRPNRDGARVRVGDRVFSFLAGELPDCGDYLASIRPGTTEDQAVVRQALASMDDDDIGVRDDASQRILALGHLGYASLGALDPRGYSVEKRTRVRGILDRWSWLEACIEGQGLDRDVEAMARLRHPGGDARIRRFLAGVAPERETDVDVLAAWWAANRAVLTWNPRADRYERP